MDEFLLLLLAAAAAIFIGFRIYHRLQLSLAKHPSFTGHGRISRRLARLVPYYAIDETEFYNCDGAPVRIAANRRDGLDRLSRELKDRLPKTNSLTQQLSPHVSDMQFTSTYKVPYQFSRFINSKIQAGSFLEASQGVQVKDADGNWYYDLAGSYGVNLLGYDFYKQCMNSASEIVGKLGPVLGGYHPIIIDNVERLRQISGLDEVSFHMSGTEAVMQAVRLARYHTRKSQLVTFCGSYHGWWDGVQPGVGNSRKTDDVFVLREMDSRTLKVLQNRNDIACVLINPLQAMHPNKTAPGDSMLISNGRTAHYNREAYSRWLQTLRKVCDDKGIVMIMDEVFVGFRLAHAGAQEYFSVKADMVTYGKTLGGGYPVGVVCGRGDLMKRYREDRPADVCFARGTFNAHPHVMAAMNEFLVGIESEAIQAQYREVDSLWNRRAAMLNERLASAVLPLKVVNLASIFTILYTRPSRFNWLLQFYLKAAGLHLSWVGTGRLIFSHNYTNEDFAVVCDRIVEAASRMHQDGWWWEGATDSNIKWRVMKEMLAGLVRPRDLPGLPISSNPDVTTT